MPTSSSITIRDVAAHAGVSHQTVSRVINGSERVSPETRQRVEEAIEALGYRPNATARFLATGRPLTFACLAPNLTDYTFASIIEGATTEARQHGYFMISASAPDDDTFATLMEQLISSRRAEGLIVINPYADGRHTRVPQDVPTVFVGARPREGAINSISLDDDAAGRQAVQHLLGLGHERIALITGPLEEDCSQDRQAGYEAALQEAGHPVDPAMILEGDWSATSGYEAVQQWLEDRINFTAIFAQNDRMAVGAIRSLRESEIRVPEDVSVIGLDDMPLASYFDPPLTTMRQDMLGIGREAARLLVTAVENPGGVHQHERFPVELIVRRSTAQKSS